MKKQTIHIELCRLNKAMELLEQIERKVATCASWGELFTLHNEKKRRLEFFTAVQSRIEIYIHRHSAILNQTVNH